jgi:hypothetical protein
MKTAIVKQRGRNNHGDRILNIVCPVCDHRHWMHADPPITSCPRRPKSPRFTITTEGTK